MAEGIVARHISCETATSRMQLHARRAAGVKRCYCCGEDKPLDQFSVDKSRSDGLQARCKTCYSTWKAASRAQPPRELYSPQQRKEMRKVYARRYRVKSGEALRTKSRLRQREYYKANQDRYTAHARKREAIQLKATPAWADLGKIAAMYTRSRLLSDATGAKHHVDHIVPLRSKIVCGLHCEANLQLLQWDENLRKSNRFWPDMP